MSFTMERSESPPRNGLSQMFSRTRRERSRKTKDSNSTKSNSSDNLGVQASIEDAIDKLKPSKDDGDDSESSGLKKLVPKGIGSKRRKKKQEREEELRFSEDAERGRSVAERGTLEDDPRSVAHHSSGDGSSLITYDSENESPLEAPPLQTHQSHIGYLTTSSPLVHSTNVPEISLAEAQLDGATPRGSTFPLDLDALAASDSNSSLVDTALQAPPSGSGHRSPSPVGRLKKAFTSKRGSSPNTSPERKVGGGASSELLVQERASTVESRRGSVSTRIGSIIPDRQASPQPSAISSPERPQTAKLNTIDTDAPPSTPPAAENPAPIIVNTPPTPTDTSSPRFPPSSRPRGPSDTAGTNSNVVTSPSGNMISHRRMRSGSATLGPSKLSNITSAPLTPTLESGANTPSSGGFFSSVFSAAQNAANTLSNSIANTTVAPGNRSRSGTQDVKEVESPVVETFADKSESEGPSEEKELAVKTLGMGDLSLSQLGISESSGPDAAGVPKRTEETRGRSESANDENRTLIGLSGLSNENNDASSTTVDDIQPLVHPRSVYEPVNGDQTPPNGSVFEGKTGIHRSGSIRSAIGNRRKRGSSAATGTTIGAAIAAANGSLANPHSGPKITGFAVASKKRNRDFHQLFRSVPDDDYLIEDYSCALQREILAHGRLYVSEGHLCFSSNIFGWVTTLVMSFDEIVSVEKRSTALVFKNGLMISTLHAKNIFASFTSRDSTYDLIVGIWKLGHPSLRSSLNGVRIEETGGGDKTEKDDGPPAAGSQSGSESDSEGEDGDEIYDEDDDDEDGMSFTHAEGSVVGSDTAEKVVSRKPSAAVVPNGVTNEKAPEGPAKPLGDFPGPAVHAPTDCTDQETHYAKVIMDENLPAPLGKIYSLMFGPESVTWMRNWLTVEQKCLELTIEDSSKRPLGLDNKVRNYSYIKPLNGAIGPRQTKCVCTETLDSLDFEKAISVTISTQTPDVPSGNVFSTKTKYCLSWAEGNATRLQMNCAIEWTGKSWLKGPIEKGANDGQVMYAKDIVASLKAAVSSRRGTVAATTGKGKKKGRKGRQSDKMAKQTDGASEAKSKTDDWGILEPLQGILGPIFDIVKPLLTGNILYGLLVGLLVASWFGFGFSGRGGGRNDLGLSYFGTPERVAAYEEIWSREESELWQWLEDRVGTDRLRDVGRMPIEAQAVRDRFKDERMDEREVDAAIKVTEEKLRVLKASVERMKKKVEITRSTDKEPTEKEL